MKPLSRAAAVHASAAVLRAAPPPTSADDTSAAAVSMGPATAAAPKPSVHHPWQLPDESSSDKKFSHCFPAKLHESVIVNRQKELLLQSLFRNFASLHGRDDKRHRGLFDIMHSMLPLLTLAPSERADIFLSIITSMSNSNACAGVGDDLTASAPTFPWGSAVLYWSALRRVETRLRDELKMDLEHSPPWHHASMTTLRLKRSELRRSSRQRKRMRLQLLLACAKKARKENPTGAKNRRQKTDFDDTRKAAQVTQTPQASYQIEAQHDIKTEDGPLAAGLSSDREAPKLGRGQLVLPQEYRAGLGGRYSSGHNFTWV